VSTSLHDLLLRWLMYTPSPTSHFLLVSFLHHVGDIDIYLEVL
jgi:hypothetical protein